MVKKKRIRFKKLIGIGVAGYFMFWSVNSVMQLWRLTHQETVVRQNIAATDQQNAVLQKQLRQLQNPNTIKAILQGKAPDPGKLQP